MSAALLLVFGVGGAARAETIHLTSANKTALSARYLAGRPGMPAVLILHGFLQTSDFFTVQRLADFLASEGYPVLTPTLSLGINQRKTSLSCDAIHTHHMRDDLEELDQWVQWLSQKTHQPLILIGHSYGSLQLLIYVAQHQPQPRRATIAKVIGTSLVDIDHLVGEEVNRAQMERAKKMMVEHNVALEAFQVSYCSKYLAPADAFLSYSDWGEEKLKPMLRKLRIPVHVILGSGDERMSKNWPAKLKAIGAKVQIIEGANHFFDAQFEFDLAENILDAIKN